MSETQNAQAPWVSVPATEDPKWTNIIDANGHTIATVWNVPGDGGRIAAKLGTMISAAPLLLEACEEGAKAAQLRRECGCEPPCLSCVNQFELAAVSRRAAIAAAKKGGV